MKVRKKLPTELTPEARLERAKRVVADAVADMVVAQLAIGNAQNEWIDQKHSPLGRLKHLELVRTGKLPGRKLGHSVLVRRDDLNAYIEREGLRREVPVEEQDVVDIVEELTGAGRR